MNIKNWKQFNENNSHLTDKFGWDSECKDAYEFLTGLGWIIEINFGGEIDSATDPDGELFYEGNNKYSEEELDAIAKLQSLGE